MSMEKLHSDQAMTVCKTANKFPLHRQMAVIKNVKQEKLLRTLNLCRETDRQQTFTPDWPHESAPPGRDMAAAGWFYLGNLDRAQCFSCGGVLRNWRRLDNPFTEHITHFPHCSMAQGQEAHNVPNNTPKVLQTLLPRKQNLSEQQKTSLFLMFPCQSPTHLHMEKFEDRLETFSNWFYTRARPNTIAEAGFFAIGVRDRVKCFYCNGGLQNWKQNDNPWEEHAKWYPTCEYLLQQQGPEFVHKIVSKFPNIKRPVMRVPRHDVPPPPMTQIAMEGMSPTLQPRPNQGLLSTTSEAQTGLLEEAMKSEIAGVVRGLGFDEDLVREVIRTKIQTHGDVYQTAERLFKAVDEAQRKMEEEEDQKKATDWLNKDRSKSLFSSLSVNETMVNQNPQNLCHSQGDTDAMEIFPEHPTISNSLPFARTGPNGAVSEFAHEEEKPSKATTCRAGLRLSENTNAEKSEVRTTTSAKNFENFEKEARLRETLKRLEDERTCKVCLDEPADMVFIPCAHICCCLNCTQALRICPICRMKIEKAVRTYTS